MHDRRLYSLLTIAGVTPFVAAAIAALAGCDSIGPFGSPARVALSYGLVITSFLAGAHWATSLYNGPEPPLCLFVPSNAVVLGCWFPYLLASAEIAIASQIAAFAFLLYVDYRLFRASIIDVHYLRMRGIATALACASLLTIALSP